MTTLGGTLLQPRSPDRCDVIPDTIVRFDENGPIVEVGTETSRAGDLIGGDGCWILPGFIDAHLHLPQWDRRGIDGLSLFAWLERVVYPAEARLKDPSVAESLAEAFVTGLVANGTTTAVAFGSPFFQAVERVFEVFSRRGFRAVYGMTLSDMNFPDELRVPTDQSLDQSRELAAKWHGANDGLLRYAFSPRMASCCSEKLLRGVVALSDMLECPIQTHVAESAAEEEAVRERYPDHFDDVEVFAEVGLLTARTLLGHGVYVSGSQRQQIAEAKTAVVHCPTANLFLQSGLMDYVEHSKAGIPIALGSSIAAGFEPFMPRVAVACLQTAKTIKVHAIPRRSYAVPGATEAWWRLTKGGADAIGMGDSIGSIEPGHQADCLVVRPEPWITDLSVEEQVSVLLHTMRARQIEHVFIGGKRVGP